MYTTRINIALKADEKEALWRLCEQERRDPRAQAAMLIRWQLEKLGLLQPNPPIQEPIREPA